MTSPTGRAVGFSLLEVLITLAIIAIFSGFFMLRFDGGGSDRTLEISASELRRAALLAKKRASAFRRDHFLVFEMNRYLLTDRPPAASSQLTASDGVRHLEAYSVSPEIRLEILRFGESRWEPLKNHVWRFRSSGLNDPLGLRFSTGQSFIELRFDALTGMAEEENSIE